MSFTIELNSKTNVEIVCKQDSALDMTDEDYAHYLEDVSDKQRLTYKPGCDWENTTRFVFRKVLPFRAAQRVIDQQVSATQGRESKEVETRFSLKYIMEEVRCALIDIINPADELKPLPFKKGNDGNASEELVAGLYAAGVVGDLHTGWSSQSRKDKGLTEKK